MRDANGDIAYSQAVPFLPEDESFTSFGVVSASDTQPRPIGMQGEFYPTYAFSMKTGPFSVFPDDDRPLISMLVWAGKAGSDPGTDQSSVYALNTENLTPLKTAAARSSGST